MKYFTLFSLLLLSSCTNTKVQEELISVKQQLAAANEKISQLETQIEPEGKLVHLLLFKIKPDADQTALITEIEKLKSIKEVMDLEIGPFEDMGDTRALSEYSMLMQMSFADKIAYENYQKNPIHLALKKKLIPFMAGPPASYDFVKK